MNAVKLREYLAGSEIKATKGLRATWIPVIPTPQRNIASIFGVKPGTKANRTTPIVVIIELIIKVVFLDAFSIKIPQGIEVNP